MIAATPAAFHLLICAALFAVPLMAASSDSEKRISDILSRMTTEEKVDLIGGVDGFYIRAIPRVGLPKLKTSDGPIGTRNDGPATTMAGGIALAATWNPALAERVGGAIATDARAACTSCWARA